MLISKLISIRIVSESMSFPISKAFTMLQRDDTEKERSSHQLGEEEKRLLAQFR